MLSTLLAAAAHHSDVDLDGLVICLLFGLIVAVLVFAILRAAGVRYADLIGLCAGALVALACWF